MRRRPTTSCLCTALLVFGAFVFNISVDSTALSFGDRLGYRLGLTLLVCGGAAVVAVRVRRLTADDLERARQDGFDHGYELGSEARCEIMDLDLARASRTLPVAERGAAH